MNDFRFVTIGSRPTLTPAELMGLVNPTGAQDYFVDLNRSVAGDGLNWDTAFTTIAAAITASNASIGLAANRWWARRNRIFVLGDGIDEDLTVLPEKCDIIGLGTDLYPFPRIVGHHVFALAKAGCRLINLGFVCDGAVDLLTFPASTHGLQILDCTIFPPNGVGAKAIKITSSAGVRLIGNRILPSQGDMAKTFTHGISLEGVYFPECEISGNKITSDVGILTAATLQAAGGVMDKNIIHAKGLTINDLSLQFQVVDNRLMTDVDIDADTTLGVVCAPELACGNIVTGSGTAGTSDWYPWARVAA